MPFEEVAVRKMQGPVRISRDPRLQTTRSPPELQTLFLDEYIQQSNNTYVASIPPSSNDTWHYGLVNSEVGPRQHAPKGDSQADGEAAGDQAAVHPPLVQAAVSSPSLISGKTLPSA